MKQVSSSLLFIGKIVRALKEMPSMCLSRFFLLCLITTLFFLTSSCFAQVKVYERWNMCSLILSKWVLFGFAYFSLIFITLSNKHSFLRDEVCLNENRSDLEDERLQHSTDFFSGEKFSTIHIKSDTV